VEQLIIKRGARRVKNRFFITYGFNSTLIDRMSPKKVAYQNKKTARIFIFEFSFLGIPPDEHPCSF
jgi:hypothetical protein